VNSSVSFRTVCVYASNNIFHRDLSISKRTSDGRRCMEAYKQTKMMDEVSMQPYFIQNVLLRFGYLQLYYLSDTRRIFRELDGIMLQSTVHFKDCLSIRDCDDVVRDSDKYLLISLSFRRNSDGKRSTSS
jgi:hypothetical protein